MSPYNFRILGMPTTYCLQSRVQITLEISGKRHVGSVLFHYYEAINVSNLGILVTMGIVQQKKAFMLSFCTDFIFLKYSHLMTVRGFFDKNRFSSIESVEIFGMLLSLLTDKSKVFRKGRPVNNPSILLYASLRVASFLIGVFAPSLVRTFLWISKFCKSRSPANAPFAPCQSCCIQV